MAHILVVDDVCFIHRFLKYELSLMGHQVTCVEGGEGLFRFLEKRTPDLVLLDPGLNLGQGGDLLQGIKRPERPWIPAILFSHFSATLQDPRAILADGYVIKSAETENLKAEISRVLGTVEVDIAKGT